LDIGSVFVWLVFGVFSAGVFALWALLALYLMWNTTYEIEYVAGIIITTETAGGKETSRYDALSPDSQL
jgi:hypothetical protein